jgi:hypothetical protein
VKSLGLNDSPLFSVRTRRATNQQQNSIISQYLGKGVKNDTTPPITTCILNPPEPDGENGWYVSTITVTLIAIDDDSGVNITKYQIDAGAWQTYTQPFNIALDGQHVLRYFSVDNAGNIEPTKSVTVAMDRTKPLLRLNYSVEGNFLCGYAITFNADATDATSGMHKVEFYLNDLVQKTIVGPGPLYLWDYPCSYMVRGFIRNPEITGEYVKFYARVVMISGFPSFPPVPNLTISAIAYDNAGNWEKEELVTPTFRMPVIKPGFYLFRDVTLPSNYSGYIGRYFIRASFHNF